MQCEVRGQGASGRKVDRRSARRGTYDRSESSRALVCRMDRNGYRIRCGHHTGDDSRVDTLDSCLHHSRRSSISCHLLSSSHLILLKISS